MSGPCLGTWLQSHHQHWKRTAGLRAPEEEAEKACSPLWGRVLECRAEIRSVLGPLSSFQGPPRTEREDRRPLPARVQGTGRSSAHQRVGSEGPPRPWLAAQGFPKVGDFH